MPYSSISQEWSELIETNKIKILPGIEDLCIRGRLLLKKLEKSGSIKLKDGGGVQYHVLTKVNRAQMTTLADMQPLNYARVERCKQWQFAYGGFVVTDAVGFKEMKLMEGYPEALRKRFKTVAKDLADDMRNQFPAQMYVDGYASGNEDAILGFDSCTGFTTCASSDNIATPNDTYGNLVTNLANYGGTWSDSGVAAQQYNATLSNDWPFGSGSDIYDFNAPKLVNWHSSAWGTGVQTWIGNCERAIRFTLAALKRNGGKPDMLIMPSDFLLDLKNYFSAERQWMPPHEEGLDLGFADTLKLDGLMVTDDYDCTSATAYMLQSDKINLRSCDENLFWLEPDMKNSGDLSLRTACGFIGQMDLVPKYLGRIADFD